MHPPRHAIEAVTHADPYPFYRSLRETQAVYFDTMLQLWVASSWAAVEEALRHGSFRVRPIAEPVPRTLFGCVAGEVFAQLVRMTDGESHAVNRAAVDRATRRWTLADVAKASEDAARDLRPGLAANEFMEAHAVQAVARLLGVPGDALDQTCRWVRQFTSGIAPNAPAPAVVQACDAAVALMAQGQDEGLSPAAAANRIGFMQQALDATAGLLGHTALKLEQHAQPAAVADSSLDAMRRFVAEVERYCAPVQNTRRFAAEPLMLAGQSIAAGQGVLLLLASANRDGALNALPDSFDPQRAKRRSMGFGLGAHACPGAAIAIEIVAAAVRYIRTTGQFDQYFGRQTGFRPLANARIPVFEP